MLWPSDAWVRRALGWRNSGTALAIASTPVSAEQPEANARRISRAPTVSVAGPRWWPSGTAGWVRNRPPRITAAMATMNSSVGTVKTLADSETPHRFSPVIRASAARPSTEVSRCCSSYSGACSGAPASIGGVVMASGCHQDPSGLLPGDDQAVLLAEALQVPAGHVLHPVQRLGVLGV